MISDIFILCLSVYSIYKTLFHLIFIITAKLIIIQDHWKYYSPALRLLFYVLDSRENGFDAVLLSILKKNQLWEYLSVISFRFTIGTNYSIISFRRG